MQCVVNDFVGGNVTLSWLNVPNPCGAFVSYKIFGANTKAGPYSLITTVVVQAQNTYTHTGALPLNPNWFYYMEADFNCAGSTPLQSDTIQNETNPQTPAILHVDADCNGCATLYWAPSVSPQTKAYIIYAVLPNGLKFPLDTVGGRFTTSFTDCSQNTRTQVQTYTIAALDSCAGNPPSAFNTNPQSSILLNISTVTCEKNLKLNWTKYLNFPKGVKEYRIYAAVNSSIFQWASTITDTAVSNASFSNYNDGDSVCIKVVAISADDTTIQGTSNCACIKANIVQPPAYEFITNISVVAENKIEVTWITDIKGEILKFQVENSGDCVSYSNVAYLDATAPVNFITSFIDSIALTDQNPYCYKITGIDSCQGRKISEPAKSIFLTGELSDYYEVILNFNDLEIYGASVKQYNLYRDMGYGFQLIKTFTSNPGTYKDSLYQFLYEKGTFCYKIEAVYDIVLPDAAYSATLKSYSNIVCINHRPIIYIPNAFVPTGVNQIFKPTIFFGEPTNYSMLIFDRYGGCIFQSNELQTGWNGKRDGKGKECDQGGYVYLIKFRTNEGVDIEKKGTVLLINK